MPQMWHFTAKQLSQQLNYYCVCFNGTDMMIAKVSKNGIGMSQIGQGDSLWTGEDGDGALGVMGTKADSKGWKWLGGYLPGLQDQQRVYCPHSPTISTWHRVSKKTRCSLREFSVYITHLFLLCPRPPKSQSQGCQHQQVPSDNLENTCNFPNREEFGDCTSCFLEKHASLSLPILTATFWSFIQQASFLHQFLQSLSLRWQKSQFVSSVHNTSQENDSGLPAFLFLCRAV